MKGAARRDGGRNLAGGDGGCGGYGGGFQGGDRGRGGGGGGRGGGGGSREGDWPCPNTSCANLNFARRTECNNCGAVNPASAAGGCGVRGDHTGGGNDYHRGTSGDYNKGGRESYNNRGSGDSSRGHRDDFDRGRGGYGGNRNERSGGYGGGGGEGRGGGYRSGGSDAGKGNDYGRGSDGGEGGYYGGDDSSYNQVSPSNQSSYGGVPGGYSHPNNYSGNSGYSSDAAPPTSYTGGGHSYPSYYSTPQGSYRSVPSSYVAPPNSYGALPNSYGSAGSRSGTSQRGGYTGRDGGSKHSPAGGYSALPVEQPQKVKQCDENCGDDCDNLRIYISNLPLDVTVDELKELFGSIGQVGRVNQKRGYKDEWPWNIKIYTDDDGKYKGDAVLSYEDPFAAHAAGGFYNNYDLRGHKISVAMAEKTAPRAPSYQHWKSRDEEMIGSQEAAAHNFSLLGSQIQNLRFGPHTLAIVESLLVSKDARSLILTRSRLRDFLRSHSLPALNSVAHSPLLHKLSVIDFFIASFALVADVESCLALRYEALLLRELKHAKFPSLQVSIQEWLTFSNDSFENGFYSMAVKGCENALLRLQSEGDKNIEFSSRMGSVSMIKELRDRAEKFVASKSVKTRTANYLRNKVIQQSHDGPVSVCGEEFASSKYRLGIKKRHQKMLEEIRRR